MAQLQVQPQAPHSGTGSGTGTGPAGNGVVGSQFPMTSLYVGDLELNVTDSQLFDLFSQVGPVVSVRVCRDANSRRSFGYAYVNYSNAMDALTAMEVLNFTPVNNKPIRITYSNRDPSTRKSGAANIFIKNLDKTIDNKALYDTFSVVGNVISCKVATDPSGQSKGYGFVVFDREEAAQNAIGKLNGTLLNDKQVFVMPFLPKQEREDAADKAKFTNVFVKNLSESTTDDDIKVVFGEFGNITSAVVMRDSEGKSKCFGFVNFELPEVAARAVQELNGKKFDNKKWYVGRAQKKSEREIELKGRIEQSMNVAVVELEYQAMGLYLKSMDASISEANLKDKFSEFGTVTSSKVILDANGGRRWSAFVTFSTAEEVSRARAEMKGEQLICGKRLCVAFLERYDLS